MWQKPLYVIAEALHPAVHSHIHSASVFRLHKKWPQLARIVLCQRNSQNWWSYLSQLWLINNSSVTAVLTDVSYSCHGIVPVPHVILQEPVCWQVETCEYLIFPRHKNCTTFISFIIIYLQVLFDFLSSVYVSLSGGERMCFRSRKEHTKKSVGVWRRGMYSHLGCVWVMACLYVV